MIFRRSTAGICIFTMFLNIAFLCAQDSDEPVIEKPEDIELIDEASAVLEEQPEPDSVNTGIVAEESLLVETQNVVEEDSLPVTLAEELPKKQFKGTSKDVILAFASIIGWLFFMWLTANQRE